MKILKFNTIKFANEEIKQAIKLMLESNFEVITSDNQQKIRYVNFSEGSKLGYLQGGDWGHGVKLSTVHKPNRECGTGFGIMEEATDEINIDLLRSCFIFAPQWAKKKQKEAIKKYDGVNDYILHSNILEQSFIIL